MSRATSITAGNVGVGFEAAKELAADRPTRVVLACRDSAFRKHAVEQLKAMVAMPC